MDKGKVGPRIRWAYAHGRNGPLTQTEFARRCGWGQSRVANYVRKTNEPTLDDLKRMAEVAGVSYQWLSTGEGEPLTAAAPQLAETDIDRELRALRATVATLVAWAIESSPGSNVALAKTLRRTSRGLAGVAFLDSLLTYLDDPPESADGRTRSLQQAIR